MAVPICTVSGVVYDSQGQPRPGVVVLFEPVIDAGVVPGEGLIVYTNIHRKTDANGQLPPTDIVASNALGVDVPWRITIRAQGESESRDFIAPEGALDFGDIPWLPSLSDPVESWVVFQAAVEALMGGSGGGGPHTHPVADISDSTAVGRAVVKAADALAARTAIGAGTSNLALGTTAGTAADAGDVATSLAAKADGAATSTALGTKADAAATSAALALKADADDVAAAIAETAPAVHSHTTGDVTGLDAALGSKADASATTTALAGKAATTHTHPSSDLSDSTATGRSVVTAANAAAARTAIGAGTSSLALGSTSSTAAAGDHTHTAAAVGAAPASHTHPSTAISDSTAVGRSVLTATDAAAARTAVGAGTSSVTVSGSGSGAAAPAVHTHAAADVSDSTAVGRSLLTAASALAARTAINAAEAGAGGAEGQIVYENVLDHGVVGNNSTDDTTAFVAAAAAATASNRTLWVPAGLSGVRLTAPVDLRYLDVLFESTITIAHTTGPGLLLGNNSTQGTARHIEWRRIKNTATNPSVPSVRIVGLKAGEVYAGYCDFLQLYADGAVPADDSIAYSNFYLAGGLIGRLEFLAVNGDGWINDNKFFGGRLQVVSFLGTYGHNGNKFYGSTVENSTLTFDVGSENHFWDVRAEGTNTASFADGTWNNVITTSYTSNSALVTSSGITVSSDLGTGNVVTSTQRSLLDPTEVFRFDRYSRVFDGSMEYRGTPPVPGLSLLRIRTQNADLIDTGMLPIDQVAHVNASGVDSASRVTHFLLTSSHELWRPKVFAYDAAGALLSSAGATNYITGGWSSSGDGSFVKGVPVASARIIVRRPEVKFLRIVISSSVAAGTAFEWVSLVGYTRKQYSETIAQLWRRALARPLAQASAPTQGAGFVGEQVGAPTGVHQVTARVDTTLGSAAASGAGTVTVASASGIASGDVIGVLLTDGTTHWTTVNGAPAGAVVTLGVVLPSAAASGLAVVTNRWSLVSGSGGAHTHPSTDISDSTATGRSVLTAADASAARTAIGAGTSSLALGSTSSTAAAGDHTHTAAAVGAAAATHTHASTDISDSTATGRSVVVAATAAAARTAIGAGTSSLVIGTGAGDAAAGNHTHTATGISDSTATGRSVLTATDAAAARTAIGAGTSSLALGSTGTTAAAGNHTHTAGDVGAAAASHTHPATQISDSTATGRSVVTAADAAAARTAIGAGTSSLALGTTSSTAKAGDYQPTAANISDSTATGRSVLTAASAAAGRTALGAGVVDSSDATVLNVVKITQAAYTALGTKVATTLYVIVG